LLTLQRVVDQFVIHFDVCGTSRQCFKVLHDIRGLSVHFMLDLDGTIYQTLDSRSARGMPRHPTAAPSGSKWPIWVLTAMRKTKRSRIGYQQDADGKTRVTIPERFGDGASARRTSWASARNEPVKGVIQGRELTQYDYTPEQYRALAHLTAALCKGFPEDQMRLSARRAGQAHSAQIARR
jgi:hypothetical protein